jgi:hypothetical protein
MKESFKDFTNAILEILGVGKLRKVGTEEQKSMQHLRNCELQNERVGREDEDSEMM